jgi:PleD family two-component response regulator
MSPITSESAVHRMKILIIDDEKHSVMAFEHFLRKTGYSRVLGITDSRAAVETCAEFDPDLILLDLIMPNIDGYTILETLRANEDPENFLPIVVLTADTTEEAKEHALQAGTTDFLVKPVSRSEALVRIRNLLEVRRLYSILQNQRAALEDALRRRGTAVALPV